MDEQSLASAGRPATWQASVVVPRAACAAFEDALDGIAASLWLEPAGAGAVRLSALVPLPRQSGGPVAAAVARAAGEAGLPAPEIDWQRLPDLDWVSEGLRRLDRVNVGPFTIRGSHLAPAPAAGRIELVIDAGQAFGTGHHATTLSCLDAIARLGRARRFARPLDLGTGTGILAMAMARMWRVRVLAVDVDPLAIAAARANAAANALAPWVEAVRGAGFGAPVVRRRAPFDLIAANILARPLAAMAPALARHLAPGGVAVLSGLLEGQQAGVAAAYRRHGLRLVRRELRDGWATLTLRAH